MVRSRRTSGDRQSHIYSDLNLYRPARNLLFCLLLLLLLLLLTLKGLWRVHVAWRIKASPCDRRAAPYRWIVRSLSTAPIPRNNLPLGGERTALK